MKTKTKKAKTTKRRRSPAAHRMRVWVAPRTPGYLRILAAMSRIPGLTLMARLMREPATLGVEIIWHAAQEADVVGAVSEFEIAPVDEN